MEQSFAIDERVVGQKVADLFEREPAALQGDDDGDAIQNRVVVLPASALPADWMQEPSLFPHVQGRCWQPLRRRHGTNVNRVASH